MNEILEAALKYADLGWCSFAVNKEKKPIVNKSWVDECTTEKEKLERLFANCPHRGIGIATEQSGLFVLDVDVKTNGVESLEALEDEHGKLPDTLISQTGGGGRHYYFIRPVGGAKSSAGRVATGCDIRCDSGYVVAPPSPHASGIQYCWQDEEPEDIKLAPVPDWLLELARGSVANAVPVNRERQNNGWKGNTDVQEGARNDSLISYIGLLIQVGGTLDSIYQKVHRANIRHLQPPLPQDEVSKMLDSAIERWAPPEARQQGIIRPLGYYQNHSYRAKQFSQVFGDYVAFIPEQNVWSVWIGSHWNMKPETENTLVKNQIDKLNERLWDLTAGMQDPLRQEWIKWAKQCESNSNIIAVISIARAFMFKSFKEFNTDDYIFSCKSGLVDLREGKLLEHNSKYLITQTSNVELSIEESCPHFLTFLDDITNGDENLKDYLQKLVGYCLTGSIKERAVFIMYGHGKNGKSTFLRILHDLMGDYAKAQSTQTFMDKGNDSIRNDLASLHDTRLVTTSEVGRNGILDSTLIKEFTGGDPITCRFLYRESFTYIPKFKLIMAVNQRPNLSVKDQAIWDRIHLIPFTVRISEEKLIPQELLLSNFQKEMGAILRWAIKGCGMWQKEGLKKPESVIEATEEYKSDVDPTISWLETRYTGNDADTVPTGLLYDDFMKFARENEIQLPETYDARRFGNTVMKKYKSKAKRVNGSIAKHYWGFRLPN